MTTPPETDANAPSRPCVSVLITTYNAAGFIRDTIDSVLSQSFTDFELVVVDDGSTDETFAILAGIGDPRLRILRTPRNLGIVGARNLGYRTLRGAYVATLDHDDFWQPMRLAAGVAILDAQPGTVFVGTQTAVLINGQVSNVNRPGGVTPMLLRWMLLMDCPIVYSSLLFRRDASRLADGGFMRPDALYADDYELMLRLVLQGDGALIDAPLTLYRVHGRNTTESVRAEMEQNAVRILTETYARWLGDEAPVAAMLIARHVARRRPVTSLPELDQIGAILMRLLDDFVMTYHPNEADRRLVIENAQEAYWRVVRASIRQGRIWLLGCYRRRRSLSILGRRPVDVALSVAAGLTRLLFFSGRMRHRANDV
jgi:Glycosyl transferase family 2